MSDLADMIDEKPVKEISIAGGTMCFFGLPTLWNSKQEYKKYCIITEGHCNSPGADNSGKYHNLYYRNNKDWMYIFISFHYT